ncbi:ABC transporter substrate-binding protein [Rhodobacter sp. 24-YEA-8]|uniref:ABC transporter substrate-binding protein n=1 Tax=Rhodobacter sp. 24-YEA-8 TaxID=1884310 RepID=UPI00089A0FB0|nr:ABC transporter substrate-binding protein [Rhodobacter sp. 24-YEA-8]SEB48710.1 amino acid/amide ABC transporter substrate-binding protein, HAAT family [Rhodobacter sp. 24-YEA-8]
MTGSVSLAQRLAVGGLVRRLETTTGQRIPIGFLAPLSGQVRSWGLPGLYGCQIWADQINASGGMMISGRRHQVEILAEDCGYDPDRAFIGARRLVQDGNVRFMMMLGGDSLRRLRPWLTERKILTSTLLPSDLSPDTPYLIAPSETHPLLNVTAVGWLAKNRPELRRVALCSQMDELGLPSLAAYRAAFGAEGFQITKEIRYPNTGGDADEIVAAMLATDPQVLCWCTSHTPMVHALTEAAHRQGFTGQLLSCTADGYRELIRKTSTEFMEGFLFQFPDFDDPALQNKSFFFNRPTQFHSEYERRFPGSWGSVSWEYAATLDLWHMAVQKAGTVAPVSVLAAMKHGGRGEHAFGHARWLGTEFYGNDNLLAGDWPVVRITSGRARVVGFGSIPAWLAEHGARLRQEMEALGQMWYQREGKEPLPIRDTTLDSAASAPL